MPGGSYVKTMPWGQQKPPLGYQLDRSSPFAQGLIGCWLFNEQSGAIANNIARNTHYKATQATWRQDATYYNGSAYFAAPAGDLYFPTNKLTLIADVLSDTDTATTGQGIFNQWNTGGNQRSIRWECYRANMASLLISPDGIAYPQAAMSDTGIIAVGERQHLAVVADGAKGNHYRDGKYISKGTISAVPFRASVDVQIGTGYNTTTNPFRGYITYVYAFNRALSANEIASLYAEPYCFIEGYNYGRFFSIPSGVVYYGSLIGDSALVGNGVLIGGGLTA